ncbi:DUF2303 family protein [Amycolatopsis roodepoortensis]|uniref:Uncharacterized protein YfdQ (DUF2303 family) n=1 Tax=Amycolatopsis roodepoortensis TaxID=700274 RepID=A0ABR9L3T5_9PSEU|nr:MULTISPECIES: DUF2303 family protein [Amycolatopsis]MBE1575037.1 uncharacterized protein YfdQ (DUF2303 family) [Amycolatopsis roodepoortensis]GHG97364.1 hypothetical protein GCM10017788_76820 [Amycolatopsis acidiphila]
MSNPELTREPSYDGDLIESLTRRAGYTEPPKSYDVHADGGYIVRVVRDDEQIQKLNLEGWLTVPDRTRGAATVYDPMNFVEYVKRLGNLRTTVWGDEDSLSFTAVFNDHSGPEAAGWRDHTARLQLRNDPEWSQFQQRSGQYLDQITFAEFLQDYAPSIVRPDGATLLTVAMNFKAHRKAEFETAVDLSTGDVSFTYTEQTTPKVAPKAGQIEVPREFTVALSPFLGLPTVEVNARLKFDITRDGLRIGFQLVRPDLVRRQAFADIRQTIADGLEETGIPVLLGAAPGAVTPQQ